MKKIIEMLTSVKIEFEFSFDIKKGSLVIRLKIN